jgi:AraC-like DNA-binding protein
MAVQSPSAWETYMEEAVERAVAVMRSRYHERLSVADLAAEAFFSPFHFSRIFRRALGVSPVQYLTAVRLFEAKRLLHATSLNVADIACRVGYVGIGTFTTRFTTLVGVSPGHYRRLPPGRILAIADGVRQLPSWDAVPAAAQQPRTGRGGTIIGSARTECGGNLRRLFVGAFDGAIPQGPPVAWTLSAGDGARQWRLDGVPPGRWVLIVVGEGAGEGVEEGAGNEAVDDPARPGPALSFGISRPVHLLAGSDTWTTVRVRQPHPTDPPILIPLCNRLARPQRLAS